MSPQETMCEGCHKLTRTVAGSCPNCWYVKNPSVVPPRRKYKSSGVDLPFGLFDVSNVAEAVGYVIDFLCRWG